MARYWALVLGTSFAAMACSSAQAQSTKSGAPLPDPAAGTPTGAAEAVTNSGEVEEIVVTAQKRSENLQDVPIAVSAVTSGQLARSGVKDIVDIKMAIPSLNLVSSAGYLSSSLRGIGSNGIGAGIENPIALYIDGVYYGAPASSLLTLNNVAQIEVLKGPQGTLFGRNATGGLIQITTRRPTDQTTGEFNVSYANYNSISGNGYIAGPITDKLFMDLAVSGTHQGNGWGDNRFSGGDVYKVNHDIAARSKMVIEPSPFTTFTLIGDYSDHRDSLQSYTVHPGTVSGYTPALGVFPSTGYDVSNSLRPVTDTWSAGGSLRWDQKLSDVNFMSLTAYRASQARFIFDYDGTALPLESIDEIQRDRQFSQELQLSSRSGGKFTWLVGGYYFSARSEIAPFILTANDLGAQVSITNHQRTKSLAGYAQATYEIVGRTNLTLGGRYTTEKRYAYDGTTDIFVIPLGLRLPTIVAPDRQKRFNKFTYRLSLDHRFSDEILAYASYNRGFKSGGFNASTPGSDPFRPETLDAYEIGLKTDLFDRKVRLNLAGFYYDYNDVQIQQLNAGAITIINGARAHDYGLDADLTIQASTGLRLTGGVSWLSPKFASFPNCPISTSQGGTPSTLGSCKGNQLPLAAKFTGNIGADYTVELSSGTLNLNATLYYTSGFYSESDNAIKQNGYELINTSLKYTTHGGFSIGVFGKNLTNRRVINFETTVPNGTHLTSWQAPRTYGVTAGYKF